MENRTEIGVFTKDIDGRTFITAILDGSPAAKAGLKVGDKYLQLMTVSMSRFNRLSTRQTKG